MQFSQHSTFWNLFCTQMSFGFQRRRLPFEWVLWSKSAISYLTDINFLNQTKKNGHSCPDIRPLKSRYFAFRSRLSCIPQTFERSCSDVLPFMSRFLRVHVQTFVHYFSDCCAFSDVFRPCNCARKTPPRAFIFGPNTFDSFWNLNLSQVELDYSGLLLG